MKILKLSTSWCPPCRALAPIFDKVSKKKEFSDIEFISFNVEQDNDEPLVRKFPVRSVPTLLVLDDNDEMMGKTQGYLNESELITFIKQFM